MHKSLLTPASKLKGEIIQNNYSYHNLIIGTQYIKKVSDDINQNVRRNKVRCPQKPKQASFTSIIDL
jgi:hypothetical protein